MALHGDHQVLTPVKGDLRPSEKTVQARQAPLTRRDYLQSLAAEAACGRANSRNCLLRELCQELSPFSHALDLSMPAIDAEDLIQETMIEVWILIEAGKFDPDRGYIVPFSRGVMRIVHQRLFCNESRERNIVRLVDVNSTPRTATEESPTEAVEKAEQGEYEKAIIERFFQRPVLQTRDVKLMKGLFQGHSERQIASDLGISKTAVHKRKTTLLHFLKTQVIQMQRLTA